MCSQSSNFSQKSIDNRPSEQTMQEPIQTLRGPGENEVCEISETITLSPDEFAKFMALCQTVTIPDKKLLEAAAALDREGFSFKLD